MRFGAQCAKPVYCSYTPRSVSFRGATINIYTAFERYSHGWHRGTPLLNKNIFSLFFSIPFDFVKQLSWWFQRCFHDISMGNGSVCVMRPPRHRVHCLAVINSHNPCVDTPGKLLLIILSFEDFILPITSYWEKDILASFRLNHWIMLDIRRCGSMAIAGRYRALLGYPRWSRS